MQCTGARILPRLLGELGISAVFTVPGNHSIEVLDELRDTRMPRGVVVRQEQAAGYLADGFTRVGGGLAAVLCCAGPGVLNTMAATYTADRSGHAFLNLVTAPPNNLRGWDLGFVHEFPEQLATFRDVTAAQFRARSVEDLPRVLSAAVTLMQAARARPVIVELPFDVLGGKGYVDLDRLRAADNFGPQVPPGPAPRSVERLATALRGAERPLIIAGGGVSPSGGQCLAQFAEQLSVPVITTLSGRGAIDEHHHLAAGFSIELPSVRSVVAESDCLVVLGCALGAAATSEFTLRLPECTIQVDVNPAALGSTYPHVERCHADATAMLRALLDAMDPCATDARRAWCHRVMAARRHDLNVLREREPMLAGCIEALSGRLPADTILVNDITTAAYWAWHYWKVRRPDCYLYPAHAISLGYGLPAALGAAFAGKGPVVALCGDGGMGYCLSELSTAAMYNLPIVVVVINDAGYGLFRYRQQRRFGRASLVDLQSANYADIARAHGIAGVRADLTELPNAVERAMTSGKPSLIEVIGHFIPPFDK